MARTTTRDTSPTIPRRWKPNDKYRAVPTDGPKEPFKSPLSIPRETSNGRPKVYDDARFPHIAKTLCQEYGFTQKQLAGVFGVSVPTIESWVRLHPNFRDGMREGRDSFDVLKVENALLKRAVGYEFTEVTTQTVQVRGKDSEGLDVSVPAKRITTTVKEVAPDVKACMFWLTNRQVDRWKMVTTVNANIKGKVDHNHSGTVVHAHLEGLTKEQLLSLRDMVATQADAIPVEFSPTEDSGRLELDHILQNVDQYMQDDE